MIPSRGRPRARDAAQVGERIVEAAWAVLLEVGPEALTVDKVASAARASKQTIYTRHEGKRALLQAVLEARVSAAVAGLESLPEARDARAAFVELLTRAVVMFSQPEKLMFDRVIDWIDAHAEPGEARPTRVALADRFCAMMEGHLATAQARYGLSVEEPEMAARFWLDGVTGHMRCMAQGDGDQASWARAFTDFFLRGVGARGGL